MGRKDFVRKEAKKTKKDRKRILTTNIQTPPPPVEVIGRGKKEKPEEE